ncbi:dehydrogenase [Streptomyces sulfonofaciens]|uniref:Dehydrogenase n=1 Tax=Streptomyces sulfonofaciens TaxID=68272 RepID=A0A919GFI4_9ACTN|nr:xanthine dehydrogenase family protein subunit M [Streptomyces sulfonofaciens]GHH83723.1 dehydrogenase [Streptomyces sulfonofaciens]
MRPLGYTRVSTVDTAVAAVGADATSTFLAGGTTEVDLIRLGVSRPDVLVDINSLPLKEIAYTNDGGLRIGALARMSDVARSPEVTYNFPALSQSLLLGASEQLRNMASMGGNLCQRTRCAYFRDAVSPCNKREPGTGCSALDGLNRGHAVLGTSEQCIATHPSDAGVAMVAFDAIVHTVGPSGARSIPIDDFYLLPGASPDVEHPLEHGELIVGIEVPPAPSARRSLYLKFRDRQSYEFALVSVAAAIEVREGRVADVRLALGGVGTKPWRARRAEVALTGGPATPQAFANAAAHELEPASPRRYNAFKVPMAQRAMVRALTRAMNGGA